jgi:hypothetical protein
VAMGHRTATAEVGRKVEPQIHDRQWWREEAARCGSDWLGITRLLRERINYLQHLIANMQSCDMCGASPCVNPAFCNACRNTNAGTSDKHHNDRLPHDWFEMSLDALWDYLNKPRGEAAKSTYDALFFELCAYGKRRCQDRLAALSTRQLRRLIEALIRSRARHPNITDELIMKLGDQL